MSSLENALAIVALYSPRLPALGVSEAARRIAIPKSSASRLMAAMAEHGLLEMDADRQYRPGSLAFRLGTVYQTHTPLLDLADQVAAELAERFGVTGYVSLLEKSQVIVMRMRHGKSPLRAVVSEPGSSEIAFNTAAGRALLARLDEGTLETLVPAQFQDADGGLVRRSGFMALLQTVRKLGWAQAQYSGGQVVSIAVAVAPASEDIKPVAISLSFSPAALNRSVRLGMVKALRRAGDGLMARFAGPGNDARAQRARTLTGPPSAAPVRIKVRRLHSGQRKRKHVA
jgi:DNA-binding IclR family transcriptional regulator